MWEKIRIRGGSLEQVREQLHRHLEFMPEFFKAKCLARYERIQEYLRRMDKLAADPNQPVLSVKKTKVLRREASREARAKKVALVENAIERELLDRLQKGVYGEIYNLPQKTFQNLLEKHGKPQEMLEEEAEGEAEHEEEIEYVEDSDMEEEEEEEGQQEYEYEDVNEFEPSEDELVDDLEDIIRPSSSAGTATTNGSSTKRPHRGHVEIEYEMETEPTTQQPAKQSGKK
jgi:protein MAK16